MNFINPKRCIFLPSIYLILFTFIFSSVARAADIQAQLDSSNGSSGLSVQNSSSTQVARIDSNGNLTTQGNVGVGTSTNPDGLMLNVSQGGAAPQYAVGVGDAFIQNNLEVDGTTYLNDVYINGLEVNGLTLGPGPLSMGSLTVTGETYLATSTGNVGIGTVTPGSKLAVNGGVAIGTGLSYLTTLAPANGLMVQGNVGIGSLVPGQALDVQGVIRTTGFTMSGQSPASGYVLTAADSSGDVTWSSSGMVGGWTISGNNVYETSGGNVGIGTTTVNQGALVVTNGNVGIGTWAPAAPLTVGANTFMVNSSGAITAVASITTIGAYTQNGNGNNIFGGNIGIGTSSPNSGLSVLGGASFGSYATTAAPAGGLIASGNVGIGSIAPGQALDVQGVIRTTGFTMSGQSPASGYVLTAADSSGDVTWSSSGMVGGWTISGNNVYETSGGNVGIGTTTVNQGALVVTNGNVGIGTWAPAAPLTVGANTFMVNSSGAITAVAGITTIGGYTQSGTTPNTFTGTPTFSNATNSAFFTGGNVGIGSLNPGQTLDVQGTVRTTNFTMSGQSPASGYVLTAADSSGDVTWSSSGMVGGWTISGNNVYETSGGNVGIGTTTVNQGALVVTNGNVGIGTWAPAAPLTVGANTFMVNSSGAITAVAGITTIGGYTQSGTTPNTFTGTPTFSNATNSAFFTGGNVGIGSLNPGQTLDVQGTVRTTNFTMSGQSPASGYVLTAADSSGDVTWSSSGMVGGWTISGNNVYETSGGNVGIGTTTVNQGALVVTNGNVGIGTWAPAAPLTVGANTFMVNSSGAITAVAGITTIGGYTQSGTTPNTFTGTPTFSNATNSAFFTGGNVGIGSLNPGQTLDVQGTVRTTNFTMSGQSPASGYVLTAADSSGDVTWSSSGMVGGWTISGNNVYETSGGNVGIGTTTVNQGALVVTNGNVGIGTWAPAAPLTVGANAFTVNSSGAIATTGGYTQSGIAPNTFTGTPTFSNATNSAFFTGGNVGIGSLNPGQTLDVQGTVRTTNFTMSGQGPASGYILTAVDSTGDTTWSSTGTVGGWVVSGPNVYETSSGNVGIGTTTVNQGALVVTNGNVGIGTWAPAAPLTVGANAFTVNSSGAIATTGGYTQSGIAPNTFTGTPTFSNGTNSAFFTGGNVGIGSLNPGQLVDVQGTVRTTGFTMSGQSPTIGYVLTAADSTGDTTWSSTGVIGGWTVSGSNVYETSGGNVGIGTTTVNQGALVVTNGNVGIGTWAPAAPLTVGANAFTVNSSGAIATTGGYTQSGIAPNTFTGTPTFSNGTNSAFFTGGNVGIGSLNPGQLVDVQGTVRTTGFTMSGQSPTIGYVLTAADSTGDTTWSSTGVIGGWTVSGSNVYETSGGNVGIGTTTVNQGALVVTNGNVGIGTWAPAGLLQVNGLNNSPFTVTSGGNVGIGTTTPQSSLVVTNGNVGIGTWTAAGGNLIIKGGGNVGIGSSWPGQMLDVQGTVRSLGFVTTGGYTQSGTTPNTFTGTPTFSNGTNSAFFTGGNVGIGSLNPGQLVDVQGTVRTTGFTMSGQSPTIGYVLTAADSTGDTTWSSTGVIGGWTVSGSNVYETSGGNVGIGTTTVNQGALVVTNGNVGIGTWAPAGLLQVNGLNNSPFTVTSGGNVGIGTTTPQSSLVVTNGNVGIGTWTAAGGNLIIKGGGNVGIGSSWPGQMLDVQGTVRSLGFVTTGGYTQSGTTPNTFTGTPTFSNGTNSAFFTGGNVGIGSLNPGQLVDVQGTVRTTGFTMSGQSPTIGYVLTAADSTGDTTWSSTGVIGGWTVSGSNVYETSGGNVGIGTTTVNQGALVVTNGNVGIGTWAPAGLLQVNGLNNSPFTVTSGGNVGIGTTTPQSSLVVTNGNVGIGTWTAAGGNLIIKGGGNVGIGSSWPGQMLDVQGTVRSLGFVTTGGYTQSGTTPNTFTGTPTFSNGTNSAFFTGGNVGIGSLNPGQLVDVQGTVRTTGFTMSGQSPTIGYVLTAADSTGDTTWSSTGVIGGWTVSGSNVYETSGGNVGIGTTTVNQGALVVTNGNVGIGTWAPAGLLQVNGLNNSPFTVTSGGNVGIGTTTPQSSLVVTNGNVGIGTWTAAGGNLIIKGGGNVGIGSSWPGQMLDVQGTVRSLGFVTTGGYTQSGTTPNTFTGTPTFSNGTNSAFFTGGNVGIGSLNPGQLVDVQGTVRTTGFTMSGQSPTIGYVLTAADSTGDTTWSSTGVIGGWTVSGSNVYETSGGNVGIGTTTPQSSLVVTNGNVGIGTWTAAGGNLIVNGGGNVGIGSAWPGQLVDVQGTVRALYFVGNGSGLTGLTGSVSGLTQNYIPTAFNSTTLINGSLYNNPTTGNVGLGSTNPGQTLDVQGTIRTTAFTMSGQSPTIGYVLTAADSTGDTTWSSTGVIGGWTVSGSNVYETSGGNVGIGTTTVNQGALVVTNGNVGIGTWAPAGLLQVNGLNNSPFTVTSGGNVGIGTTTPQSSLVVTNGNVGIGTWTAAGGNLIIKGGGNVGIGSSWPGQMLDVQGTVRSLGFVTTGGYTQSGTTPNTFTGTPTFSNGTNSAFFTGGNVGIGSLNPGQLVDVQGTVRTTGFTMSGQSPTIGYVLTAADSTGDTTWSSTGVIGGWTVSGSNVYETSGGNVGIGTTTPQSSLVVTNGNVGIGTWTAAGGNLIIKGGGNVGIGSSWPGQMLDVQGTVRSLGFVTTGGYTQSGTTPNTFTGTPTFSNGTNSAFFTGGNVGIGSLNPGQLVDVQGTVRTTGFTMSGQSPTIGYVLTAADSTGDTTWSSTGVIGGWTVSGSNVYETSGGNVGIGTTTPQSSLVVTNGNVGIGTWTAAGGNLIVNGGGNVGIGSAWPGQLVDVQGTVRALYFVGNGSGLTGLTGSVSGLTQNYIPTAFNSTTLINGSLYNNPTTGNVGLGSTNPGQTLDVQGTIRTTAFTMSGQSPTIGYVLTAADSTGDTTWSSTGVIGGWTVSGSNVYETSGGNVGIGTTTVNQGALVVTNGNVGIGTWAPAGLLQVNGLNNSPFTVTSGGNVGIGTTTPQSSLVVTNGNVGIGTWTAAGGNLIIKGGGNVGIGSSWPGQMLDVQGTVRSLGFVTTGGYTQSGTTPNTFTGTPTFSNGTNSAFFTGGNVGIGSLNPGQLVDVQGTVRTTGFTMSGQSPTIGYVLTAADSTGDTTWSSTGVIGGWTVSGSNVYETSGGNVGIGTTTPQSSLVVTNGNVGIGTWTAAGGNLIIKGGGNVGIGSAWPGQMLDVQGTVRSLGFVTTGGYTQSGTTPNTFTGTPTFSNGTNSAFFTGGNVGIGSLNPGQLVDVQGTVRTTGFTMSGQSPTIGYVLTAADSTGDTTWSSTGVIGGWTVSGSNVYETSGGNVGIGTTTPQSSLVVTNGNVGIGTWTAAGGNLIIKGGGNVGIGSSWPGQMLDVQGTVRSLGFVTTGGYTQSGTTPNTFTGTPTFSNGTNSAFFTGGNVGIGSLNPGQLVDVQGTVRTTGFTMSQSPSTGYVLTAADNSGDVIWSSSGTVGGWTISGDNVYETSGGNVGIGTTTPQSSLVVTNGNVGIGTWTAAGGNLIIKGGGNVGIGSAWPGQMLDVQGTVRSLGFVTTGGYTQSGTTPNTFTGTPTFSNGTNSAFFTGGNVGIGSLNPGQLVDVQGTVRTTGFTMSGQSPTIGYVLTAADSTGDTTWSSTGVIGGWTVSGSNVYETSGGNVGIGTTTPQSSLVVTNGNVGIGTWTAAGGNLIIKGGGNVGIGSAWPGQMLDVQGTVRSLGFVTTGGYTQSGTTPNTFTGTPTFSNGTNSAFFTGGNVGIGSLNPGQLVDVQGTVRTTGFTMSGQSPTIGYVLTAADSTGDTTWSSTGVIGGWTVSGSNVYETSGGNVGIGTTTPQSSLVVTNGNVGIGTWTAAGGNLIIKGGGNVGIGSAWPGQMLDVQGTVRALGEIVNGNVGIGTSTLQTAFAVSNGNVGIGTWTAAGGNLIVNGGGNVGIGSAWPGQLVDVQGTVRALYFVGNGSGLTGISGSISGLTQYDVPVASNSTTVVNGNIYDNYVSGNIGIGSTNPGQILDVQGTVRTTGFTMSGQSPTIGYVLTAADSTGDTTWSSTGVIGGWTVSGSNVYETSGGNVGIGTTTPQSSLVVTNGNVGIGTWTAAGGNLIIKGGGNVGIGSSWPGQMLDVQGTARMTGFVLPANGAGSGYVLTSNSVGVGTWMPAGSGVVNPGTAGQATYYSSAGTTVSGTSDLVFVGSNIGIGSASPGQILDVQGTVRTTGFTMSGQSPTIGYVLTAADSTGDTTWSSTGVIGGWTVSGSNVYETSGGNVGIGTTTPQSSLVVTNGNVGIGTWTAAGGNLIIKGGGNVGIGSSWPGQMLDVQGTVRSLGFVTTGGYTQSGTTPNTFTGTPTFSNGTNSAFFTGGNVGIGSLNPGQLVDVQGTVRTTGFTMSGQSPTIGYVLTAADSTGDVTWSSSGVVGGWTVSGSNVYETSGGNVGIGTTTPQSSLVVTNGNVGIGTWTAAGGNLIIKGGGNVGIGSAWPGQMLDVQGTVRSLGFVTTGGYTQSGTTPNTFTGTPTFSNGTNSAFFTGGNVGIGSLNPGQLVDVQGTVRTTGFTMSGQSPTIGYVLTAADSTGDVTWSSSGVVGGWTVSGSNVYETSGGNVGIGTTTPQSSLVVTNGNVGIGTWTAAGGNLIIKGGGNVGIGSAWPGQMLDVQGTVRALGEIVNGNVGIGTSTLQTAFAVSNGNVGIGTWTAAGGNLIVNGGGNVGIGSAWPGQMLDVNGTVRMTGFTLNLNPNSGYVIVGNSVGVGTWMPASTLPGTISGLTPNYVTKAASATTLTNSLIFDNGTNVGIGSANPGAALDVNGGVQVDGTGVSNFSGGNVGIGSAAPGQSLDVQGTVRTTGFTMSGQSPTIGYVLTAADSTGDTTWSSTGVIGGWTVSGSNVYETSGGNVGIGTTTPQSSLVVTNGNVGIGTWTAAGGNLIIKGGGNVGIGSAWPGQMLDVQGTVRSLGFVTTGGYTQSGTTPNTFTGTPTFSNGTNSAFFTGGNVGIGSLNPGQLVDVQGTVRTTGFTMSGQSPTIGYVLTAADSTGDVTWSSSGVVGGWTVSGSNVYETSGGNVGIGTTTPQSSLVVTNGNVGIGTWTAAGGNLIIKGGGNVGIGSAWPGQMLDVNGTVRMTGFTLNLNPNSGYVLVGNSVGVGTWMPVGTLGATSGWTVSGSNVYETSSGNVGIGTTTVNQGALVVTNGNVGIGTWTPVGLLQINGLTNSPFTVTSGGNVGVGTTTPQSSLVVTNGNVGIGTWTAAGGNLIVNGGGNVGIGSAWPGQTLDVQGTIRTTGFTMSGQSPTIGYVLTAADSTGDTTWSSTGVIGGWTVSGSNVYETSGGNVGIGTTTPQSSLVVTNGNVGIGTWTAAGGNLIIKGGGNVGIGSAWPGQMLDVQGTIRDLGEIVNGNVGIGTSALQTAFAVSNGNVGIGTWTSSSTLSIIGSIAVRTVTVTSGSYTAAASDQVIIVNASGNVTINLPDLTTVPGREYIIKRIDSPADGFTVTIQGNGGQNIDGQNTVSTSIQYQTYTIVSDTTNTQWDVI